MRKIFIISRSLYLFLAVLSLCLLLVSRSGEVYTVWEVIHPLFIPTFFVMTSLLIIIIFSPERVEYKLLFIIIHSILSHSFFVIVFPAGNIGFQQSVLGKTIRIFDNFSPHGWGGSVENILLRIHNWFNKPNFQSVYSVMSARMFGVDVFWSHLFLIPVLWGTFVPTISFMITKALGGDERISAFSSLLGSAFPLLIYLGSISIPNSLGYIFFLGSVYFFLKYITSPNPKFTYLMLIFTFASFLSHFLTGVISFSFLLIAYSLRKYETEKRDSPISAKLFLAMAFILSTSILPFALIYHRIVSPVHTYFTLDKLYEYATTDLIGEFLLGEYFYYQPHVAIIYIIGPIIAFIWIIYKLKKTRKQSPGSENHIGIVFLLLGFVMLWLDYRILKIFMINVPFEEKRIWVFRDLISVPFVALAINDLLAFSRRTTSKASSFKSRLPLLTTSSTNVKKFRKATTSSTLSLLLMMNILIPAVLAGWISLSVYYAYPHYSPLQTTSYELEAINYIHKNTNKSYIVICDLWISYAGRMIVGAYNQKAYYFGENDPVGVALFIKMKDNPSREVLIEAMNYTAAAVAYLIMTKPRLGEEEYNRIIQEAKQNNLQTYKVFYYKGEEKEKLRIFYYTRTQSLQSK